jgi:hypothetical protein
MVIAGLLAATSLAAPVASVSIPDLVEAADVSGLALSPDRHLLAFRTTRPSIGDDRIHVEWYVVPVDGSGPARALAEGGVPELMLGAVVGQTPIWAPSSRAFYVRAAIDGEVQLWRIPVDGTPPRRMTSEPADIRTVSMSEDARSLRYEVGATRDEVERAERDARDSGVLINKSVDLVSSLVDNASLNGHPATFRFGEGWFNRQPLLWNDPVRSRMVSLPPMDVSGSAPPARPPMTVLIVTAGEQQQLKATTANGQIVSCSSGLCPRDHILSALPISGSGDVLVTTSKVTASQTLSLWNPASGRWRTLEDMPGRLDGGDVFENSGCIPSDGRLACVEAEASGPPRLVSIDLRSGRNTPLFDPNASLRARSFPSQTMQWSIRGGQVATGQLFLPAGKKPAGGFPLVIDFYGCRGYLRGGVGDELPLAPLAETGIATLCINQVRGPEGSQKMLEDRSLDAITDITDQMTKSGLVDRRRIGMTGLSFGSEVVLAVAERTDLLRAAAISSGQIEPYYYWAYRLLGKPMQDVLKTVFGVGDPDTDKAGWAENVPVAHVDQIRAPMLIQIPESEMRITVEFFTKLATSPTPAEMIAYPNAPHVKWEPRQKLATYSRNLDWFRFWLLGEEDPDPAKAAQYARWRSYSARPGFALPTEDHATPIFGLEKVNHALVNSGRGGHG